MNIDIIIKSDLWQNENELTNLCNNSARQVLVSLNNFYKTTPNGDISVIFSDDKEIQELNKKWRQQDKATNVLSFPAAPAKFNNILGDIIFAYETILSEAIAQDKNFYHHLTHLFIHGLLHLLNFDHQNEKDASEMENLEINILNKLKIKNPYN